NNICQVQSMTAPVACYSYIGQACLAGQDVESGLGSIICYGAHDELFPGLDAFTEAFDVADLGSGEAEGEAREARGELEWKDTHADEVAAMDALVAFGNNGAHTEKRDAFGRPVARAACPVLLAGDDDQRHALILVAHGGVIDGHAFFVGEVAGCTALTSRPPRLFPADGGQL